MSKMFTPRCPFWPKYHQRWFSDGHWFQIGQTIGRLLGCRLDPGPQHGALMNGVRQAVFDRRYAKRRLKCA